MNEIQITIASEAHLGYLPRIEEALYEASLQKGTGIAVRSKEYLEEKILQGKAIVAFDGDSQWAGFCYIESWDHNKYVANSGLIVSAHYRGVGLAREIKRRALQLSSKIFPSAKIFGLTTSLAVMKINSDLGYRPVTFSKLTGDDQFWKGCETCPYYDILVRTKREDCLCTAMIMDPSEGKNMNGKKTAAAQQVSINHS